MASASTPNRWLPWAMAVAVAGMGVSAANRDWWIGFVVCVAVAGVLWVLQWRAGGLSMRRVLGWAILFRLMLVPMGPSLSDDYFRYIWDGRVQVHGVNPYALTPEDDALAGLHDPDVYDRLNSKSYYSVYPPASQLLFAVGGVVYPFGWRYSYYLIKLILVAFEIAGLLLLARMVSARAVLLYAWCPLVLVEAAGQAHTEALMVFFLFACLWALQNQHPRWAVAALTGAGLVKLYPLVLIPFLLNRVGWKHLPVAVATGLAVALPYYHPEALGHVKQSLDLYVRRFEFNAGPYYTLKWLFETYTDVRRPGSAAGPILRWLFLSGLAVGFALDVRRRVAPFPKVVFGVLAAYLALSTTIHPWYFLGLMAMLPFLPRVPWAWVWLGLAAMGTYLLYPYGRGVYRWTVAVAWIGWLAVWIGMAAAGGRATMQRGLHRAQRLRSARKVQRIAPYFPEPTAGLEVLDLGAGEGFVGEQMVARLGCRVTLADVLPLNRTALPHVQYDGHTLPFSDRVFDVTVLYFVLHHCADPDQVFREALRVTRRRLIVVESVYEARWDLWLLTTLDRLANRLRSGGLMQGQEEHLHFRTIPAWTAWFEAHGCTVQAQRQRGRIIHKQAFFSLDVPEV